MARQFLTGLNLNKNELLNARIQNLALDPSGAVAGQIYYNTADNVLKYYTGSAWLTLAQGGSVNEAITNAINALDTDDIEEGSSNLYYTTARAKTDAAALLTGATKTNITITGDGTGLTITAENGVADSTTDDLDEGSTNKYFTDERAQDAVGNAVGNGIKYDDASGAISAKFNANAGAIGVDGSGNLKALTDDVSIWTSGSGNQLSVLTGEGSPVASKTYADGAASGAVTTHNNLSSGVHGVTGSVVGTSDSQTLTNKELSTGTSLGANLDADSNKIVALADPTDAQDAATKNYVDTEIGDHSDLTTGVHGVSGDVVGTTDTQTLTNKTLGLDTSLSADLDASNHKITNVGTPTDDSDAANKAYVDNAVAGLTWKSAVNLLSTTNVDISGEMAGVVIDGHDPFDGMAHNHYRILLTGQTTDSENGIYYLQWDGNLPNAGIEAIRATDADSFGELDGATVFVTEGDTYGQSAWTQANHYLTSFAGQDWVQFSGAAQIVAGAGLTKDGNTLDVVGTADRITVNADSIDIASTYAGQTSIDTVGTLTTGTWEADTIAVEYGGTGATTAAGAKTNLGFMTRVTGLNPELEPSSGVVTWVVTHNLGTKHVLVQVYETDFDDAVEVDIERTNTNQITLQWVAGATVDAEKYEVIIIG